jgi:hypothetical protein
MPKVSSQFLVSVPPARLSRGPSKQVYVKSVSRGLFNTDHTIPYRVLWTDGTIPCATIRIPMILLRR